MVLAPFSLFATSGKAKVWQSGKMQLKNGHS
jgi:hypothetical protein